MELQKELRLRVLERLDQEPELSDEALLELIDQVILSAGRETYLPLTEKNKLRCMLFDAFRGLDILQELLEDPHVTEIMVNGPDQIFIEEEGRLRLWEKRFEEPERLLDVIQQAVSKVNRIVNRLSPIVDARLPDGSRLHVVLPPAALNGPIVTIRKFSKNRITMEELIQRGSITREAADFLKEAVREGKNLFICGGTGTGKTTFLNALSDFIPENERVITIEDSAELKLLGLPNLVRLEARDADVSGENRITIRDLIKASLRMRPDRIIVGEVRSGECLDMLQAMNTGHDGSLSTGHGNSPRDMLSRLETMALMGGELPLMAIRSQIASALDIMVHLGRTRDGSRKVMEITEVTGYEGDKIQLKTRFQRDREGEFKSLG